MNGIDLGDPSPETMTLITDALADHGVLLVGDQHLTPTQQVELTRWFGEVLRVPSTSPRSPGTRSIVGVLREAERARHAS